MSKKRTDYVVIRLKSSTQMVTICEGPYSRVFRHQDEPFRDVTVGEWKHFLEPTGLFLLVDEADNHDAVLASMPDVYRQTPKTRGKSRKE